jgi:hypothetical protein
MRRGSAITLTCAASVFAASLATSSIRRAHASDDPTRMAFDVPREAVVMGDDIARTDWPTRLARPSKEGQFEVLVRKIATPIQAPDCKSQYLVVRMPASIAVGDDLAIQAAAGQKRSLFDHMKDAYANGQPMHFDVFAGPYGRRATNGKVVLSGCNLFFQDPATPRP